MIKYDAGVWNLSTPNVPQALNSMIRLGIEAKSTSIDVWRVGKDDVGESYYDFPIRNNFPPPVRIASYEELDGMEAGEFLIAPIVGVPIGIGPVTKRMPSSVFESKNVLFISNGKKNPKLIEQIVMIRKHILVCEAAKSSSSKDLSDGKDIGIRKDAPPILPISDSMSEDERLEAMKTNIRNSGMTFDKVEGRVGELLKTYLPSPSKDFADAMVEGMSGVTKIMIEDYRSEIKKLKELHDAQIESLTARIERLETDMNQKESKLKERKEGSKKAKAPSRKTKKSMHTTSDKKKDFSSKTPGKDVPPPSESSPISFSSYAFLETYDESKVKVDDTLKDLPWKTFLAEKGIDSDNLTEGPDWEDFTKENGYDVRSGVKFPTVGDMLYNECMYGKKLRYEWNLRRKEQPKK